MSNNELPTTDDGAVRSLCKLADRFRPGQPPLTETEQIEARTAVVFTVCALSMLPDHMVTLVTRKALEIVQSLGDRE